MRLSQDEFEVNRDKIDLTNVKILREKKGYSQVKLGQLVGVTNSTIQGFEQTKKDDNGKDTNIPVRIPSLPVAYRLAEVLSCSIDYLVGRSNELEAYYSLSQTDKNAVINLINELAKNNK